MLEQLSRTRFFTEFENTAFSSLLRSTEEKSGKFKFRQKLCCFDIIFSCHFSPALLIKNGRHFPSNILQDSLLFSNLKFIK